MNCIVTAGPTYEPLDDVRRLTNFSTGRLGSEFANFLTARGHAVTLLIGAQATWRGERHARQVETFTTTEGLRERLRALFSPAVEAVFHAAAVSDFSFGKIWQRSPKNELTEIKAGKISCLLDEQRGLLRRQAGQDRHGEEQALVVVLEELLLVQDLGSLQGGGDLQEKVADDLIARLPPQMEELVSRQPRVGSVVFEFVQGSIFCVAVSSLEIRTQFVEVEIDVVAGTIFGQHNAVRIEYFPSDGGDAHGPERLADLGVFVAFCR